MTWFYIIGGRSRDESKFSKIGITDQLVRRLKTIYQSDDRRRLLLPHTAYIHTAWRFAGRSQAAKLESLLLTRLSRYKVDRKTMGWFDASAGLLDLFADHVASSLDFGYAPEHDYTGSYLTDLTVARDH